MKKLLAILCSVSLMTSAAFAEIGVGITANFSSIDTEGSNTELTGDEEKDSTSVSEDVEIVEVFVESITDTGLAIGLSYIPTRALGAKTRTDSSTGADVASEADTGDYVGKAELDNLIMVYADIPVGPIYGKVGFQHAEIATLESLNSGSTYADIKVNGLMVGVGYKNDLGIGNLYYKGEVTYTNFEDIEKDNSNNSERINAEIDVTSLKVSLGMKF